jgi:hypothetical protein
MRRIISISIVVTLTIFKSSFAQPNTLGEFNKFIAQNWSGEYLRIGQYKVRGTPFLFGESFQGTIKYQGGAKSDTKILYDLYNQKAGAEFKNGILQSDKEVEEFSISLPAKYGGNILVFKNSELYGKNSVNGYLNVLDDGTKLSFLKVFRIKLVPDPSNMMDKEMKLFEQYYEYYIYNQSIKELKKIKLREKDIKKEIGDEQFVKEYITQNGLDVSKEIDMITLIQGFNNK